MITLHQKKQGLTGGKMNYMILSVDTGIDDALAIAYALGQKEYRLLGITVSYGMAPLEKPTAIPAIF